MKKITINVPDDCEVQVVKKEAKFKKGDIVISRGGMIAIYEKTDFMPETENERVASSEKVAKSMLAMAMISQLMPYYGGEITDEEWANDNILKYRIVRVGSHISALKSTTSCSFLAFHTEKQRDNFLKYNYELVKDYLML